MPTTGTLAGLRRGRVGARSPLAPAARHARLLLAGFLAGVLAVQAAPAQEADASGGDVQDLIRRGEMYRIAGNIQAAAAKVPADRYVVEPDAPLLAPVPHRGKTNEMAWVVGFITAIRAARAEINVPAGAKVPLVMTGEDSVADRCFDRHGDMIRKLARLASIDDAGSTPKGAVQVVHEGTVFAIPLAGVLDVEAEQARLEKETTKVSKEIAGIEGRLANAAFVEKAPASVVEENKTRLKALADQLDKLAAARERLSDMA